MSITPKNWKVFQHYGNRKPPWIKLHRGLLDDYEFSNLPVASRALAPCLWLLASEFSEGRITAPDEAVCFRLHISVGDYRSALKPLIDHGFFIHASDTLAPRKRDATLEREEEREKEGEVEKKKRSQGSRGASLPADWQPTTQEVEYGIAQGLTSEQVAVAAEDMRLWAQANSNRSVGRKADWSATFKSWMRRNKGTSNGKTPTVVDAQRQHIANRIEFGPRPRLIPSGAGAGPVRLLPEGGRERSGHLHGGDHGGAVGVLGGGDPACDGPEDGDRAKNKLAPDDRRG